jgi:YebC/PmpR family DNA-binding regulatory protein
MSNPRLRLAIDKAKSNNMPSDNIERAIKKGAGELPGVTYEEFTYEAYGPGGAAILIEVVTDNKNRTVSELRHLLSKYGGNLAETGSVSWMFEKKGFITIPRSAVDEDALLEIVLEAGGEDMKAEGDVYEIITEPEQFQEFLDKLKSKNLSLESSEISMMPTSQIPLEGKKAQQLLNLIDKIEDHDDVQNIHSNFDIDENELEESP